MTWPVLLLETHWLRIATRGGSSKGRPSGHILIPTVGSGNIGDQAMVEAFLANVTSPVTIILADPKSFSIPEHVDVQTVVLPDLFSVYPHRRIRAITSLLPLMQSHESLSVVGADIMDGFYDRPDAILRYRLLALGNLCKLDTRVLGFSWSGGAHRSVLRALKKTHPTTRLIVRDPRSLQRLGTQAPTIKPDLGADMVFLLDVCDPYPELGSWMKVRAETGTPVVLFNVSGLIESRSTLMTEYLKIVEGLRGAGTSVLLVPHVVRQGDDDLAACRALYRHLAPGDDVRLVDELLSPGQVAWLARSSAAVFSGRMHLSVIALCHETAVVVLSTQGKVEGMLSYFDAERMAIEPGVGMATECLERLDEALGADVNPAVAWSKLPEVRRMAAANFEGLM